MEDEHNESASFNCTHCGETKPESDDHQDVGGSVVCGQCIEDDFSTCNRCDNLTPSGDFGQVRVAYRRHESWCESCRDDHAANCDSCSDAVPRDDLTGTAYSTSICDRCREGDWGTCGECGELFRADDLHLRRSDDVYYCGSCRGSSGDRPDGVLDYHEGHPNGLKFFGRETDIFYGVELEVNSDDGDSDAHCTIRRLGESHVHLEEDGSLDDGFEIVTQPHTLVDHYKLWKPFFNKLPEGLTIRNTEVGMHVHVERKKLSSMQIARMVVFVNDTKNRAFVRAMAGRDSTYGALKNKKLTAVASEDRYEAINTTYLNTVEFRVFRSTLKEERFFANLEFVDALVHFCVDRSYRDLGYERFCKWISQRRGEYQHLAKFLVTKGYLSTIERKKEVVCV